MSRPDIRDRADIDRLMVEFYSIVLDDAEIGHHFVDLDLDEHIPIIASFWEKVLFAAPVYFGNPMEVHHRLHRRSPLETEHFGRWLEIFSSTVDRLFAGPIAEAAKDRAVVVASNMNRRLNAS